MHSSMTFSEFGGRESRNLVLTSSASISLDMAVNIWDVRRPHVPSIVFDNHQDNTADIQWKGGDPNVLLSLAKVEIR